MRQCPRDWRIGIGLIPVATHGSTPMGWVRNGSKECRNALSSAAFKARFGFFLAVFLILLGLSHVKIH
jgi:hypothetical protein